MRKTFLRSVSAAVLAAASVTVTPVLGDNEGCCATGTLCCNSGSCCTSSNPYGQVPCSTECCGCSRSFITPRSISDDLTYDNALQKYYWMHNNYPGKPYRKPENVAAFNMLSTYFYQQSTGSDKLASYFLKCNKQCLSIKEDGTGDVGSGWVNLFGEEPTIPAEGAITPFSSNLTIAPKRKIFGAILGFHHDLSSIFEGLWWRVTMPLVRAEHDIRACESNIENPGVVKNDTGDVIENALQAFNQRSWRYGRISCRKLAINGVDDMNVKIGWQFWRKAKINSGLYFDLLVPFGPRSTGEYMFEPFLGQGGSWGTGFGVDFNWEMWKRKKCKLDFDIELRYRYLFSNRQRRSFDLACNGDWSRYLLLADQGVPCVACPGINELTRDVHITPRSTINLWTALHYQHSSIGLELGYNLWWRQSEKVCPADQCCPDADNGIADGFHFGTETACSGFTSSSDALICNGIGPAAAAAGTRPYPDTTFTTISTSSLDLASGVNPSALTHKIYGGISVDGRFLDVEGLLGFGAAYEFGACRRAMGNWSVWLRSALSF